MLAITVNWWTVLGAAVAGMIVGALWHGPLFGKAWARLNNMTSEDMKKGSARASYFWTFVGLVITAYVLSGILVYAGALSLGEAAQVAFWVWLGFTAPVVLGKVLWGGQKFQAFLLDAGYYLVNLLVIAYILNRWG
ncbi:MAG: DUF1761 domain-containing protein [Patescibacteria group bacterium]